MTDKKIGRRQILGGLATGTAALGLSAKAPAYATRKRRLKMVTTWAKNFPGLGTAPENIAKRVRDMTDGQIDIKIYAAGELVSPFDSFDAVSTGTADLYNGAEYYWQGKSPAFNFFTAVPFGMTAQELANWYYMDGGMELHDELGQIFGLKSFLGGNTGAQAGGWYSKEINSPF